MKNGLMFCSVKEVRSCRTDRIFCNTRRPHMSINMRTLKDVVIHIGEIKKRWTSCRNAAIKRLLYNFV